MGTIDYIYCRYCGEKFGSEKMFLQTTCDKSVSKKHEKFRGGKQKTYRCMYCGEKKSSLKLLVNETCNQNPVGKYHIPLDDDPEAEKDDIPTTRAGALKKSALKAVRSVNDDGGNIFAAVDSVTEDIGDKIVEKTGVFGKALRATHDGGGDIIAGAEVLVESLGKKILLFIPRVIWKLFVWMIKLIFALIYIAMGGIAIYCALIVKLLEKITFVRMFKFITKNLFPAYAADGPISAEGPKGIVFNVIKVFGTAVYIFMGACTFPLWIFTKVSSWFSFTKFLNKPLNLKK